MIALPIIVLRVKDVGMAAVFWRAEGIRLASLVAGGSLKRRRIANAECDEICAKEASMSK